MRYKAVCFDLDGTLYPVNVLKSIMLKLFLFHPVMVTRYSAMRNLFRKMQGTDKKAFGDIVFDRLSFQEKELFVAKCSGYSQKKAELFINEYYAHLEKAFLKLDKQTDRNKTLKFLEESGVTVCILSDWPFYSKLNLLGLKIKPERCFYSGDAGFLKPDKRCFDYMLKGIKLSAKDVLFVGDSYKKDVSGAVNCGMDAVLVGCRDKKGKYPLALKVFKSWKNLDNWFINSV